MGDQGICNVCGGKGERYRPSDGRLVICWFCGGDGKWKPADERWPNRR